MTTLYVLLNKRTLQHSFTSTTMQPSDSTLLGRFLLLRSKRHLRRCSKPTRLIFFHPLFGHDQPQLFRSLFGFVFPLFGQPMFDKLGLGGGNSVRFFYYYFPRFVSSTKETWWGIKTVTGRYCHRYWHPISNLDLLQRRRIAC